MGEKRESGADVRFGVLPLLLALAERTELPAGPSENDPSAPSAAPAVPIERPATLPRPLVSGLLAAAALALVTALAMPVASGISPAQTGVFQSLPDVRTAAETANSAPGSTPPPSTSAAGTATSSAGRPPVSSGPVRPDARPVRAAQHVMKKAGAQAPNDTNVLLRLGAGAARAGAHDTASSLLERHARQFPATEPAMLGGVARETRAKRPARR